MSHKTHMHDNGESYNGVVPAKQPNKSGKPPAEAVEERPLTEENAGQPNPYWTPSQESGPSGLDRVREAARKNGKLRFTALLHHVTVDLLRGSYFKLKRKAAPGVDGVTWEQYGRDLEAKLTDQLTYMDESTEERIERYHHEESGSRKAMEGNDHWESRHWRTRSSSTR